MARYHAFQLTYEEVTVLDIPMIFTEARIDRSTPRSWNRRFLRLPAKIFCRNQDGMVAAGTAVKGISIWERIFAT